MKNSNTVEWLIIGGGIHGVHIAARLIGEAGVDRESVRILDPADRLLDNWRRCTQTTGMTYLRSPSVHNLDLEPFALKKFARGFRSTLSPFRPPYSRPSLELFDAHCQHVVEKYGLDELHLADRATGLQVDCNEVLVETAQGNEYAARNVVLAIGASAQPRWPGWASAKTCVHHVFDADFDGWPEPEEASTVAVVGGGISAGQVALRLISEGHRVHLVSRHPLRQHQFDSDPGWLGNKCMRGFRKHDDVRVRREMIQKARHRGSMPSDVFGPLKRSIRAGEITWHETEITDLTCGTRGGLVRLASGDQVEVDLILLATGLDSSRPGGSMIDNLVETASLECAECGYPVVDGYLRWHPRK